MNSEALCSLSAELSQFLLRKRVELASLGQSLDAIRIDIDSSNALSSEPTAGTAASRAADNIDLAVRNETSHSKNHVESIPLVIAVPPELKIQGNAIGTEVSKADLAPTVHVSGDAIDPADRLNALKMRLSKQLAKQEK